MQTQMQMQTQAQTDDTIGEFPSADLDSTQAIRRDLLRVYDPVSYPWIYHWKNSRTEPSSMRKGIPVGVGINFHKVLDVNVKDSTLDLLVWFRLTWNDPRLMWNPDDYEGLNRTTFRVGNPEVTELWYPDILLWNQDDQLGDSLFDTQASVTSDGTVFWTRPGHLKPSCKFEGLSKFPFDKLECDMEFGSWINSGLYIRPYPLEGGIQLGGSKTAGQSFSEVTLVNMTVEEVIYPPFLVAPEEDWPVLIYHATFSRAWQTYIRSFVVLHILLNIIGFLCFWMPPEGGERMGLCVTALLASVASEIVIVDQLPRSAEFTWLSSFSLASLFFSVVPIIESAIVTHFYHHTYKKMFAPQYLSVLKKKIAKNLRKAESRVERDESASEIMTRTNEEIDYNEYWRSVADMIDEVARIVIPVLYVIVCGLFFSAR